MKVKLFILTAVVASSVVISGCCGLVTREIGDVLPRGMVIIEDSDREVTQELALTGFDRVDISSAFRVDLSQSGTFSVVVYVDENLAEYVEVEVEGSTLKIRLDRRYSYQMVNVVPMEVNVTMPELVGLTASGASEAIVAGFESTKSLDLGLSGASSLEGQIEAGDTWVEASGAAKVTLTGSAQDVRIDASGGSEVDLSGFPVADADVEASGASSVTVNARGRLDVEASGGSRVYYLGKPALGRIETSGAASVEGK